MLQKKPVLDVPGMTEFMLNDNFKFGLMPENGIAKILTPPNLDTGNEILRCELYLFVRNPDEALKRAMEAGAKEIRDWNDTVSYCADPDGHIIAFAK